MAKVSSDAKDVALEALANLIRLMGAELTAGRHRDDLDIFETALRRKLQGFAPAGRSPSSAEVGRALASKYVDEALTIIRAQVAATRMSASAPVASPRADILPASDSVH